MEEGSERIAILSVEVMESFVDHVLNGAQEDEVLLWLISCR